MNADPAVHANASAARVSIVIPAKNEAGNIAWVLEQLPSTVDEVVLVDGHSTDDTVEVARRVRPDVIVVVDGVPGKGAALRSGVDAATGEHVVMLDADGSMDPQELERFLAPLREGFDLVKGSRFLPTAGTADMTILRDLGNRGLLTLANMLHRTSHTDLCYGYAAFRRDAFQRLGLTADGFEIEAQLFLRAHRQGLRVTEVPSFEAPRRIGNSNLNTFRDGWRVLRTIVAERLPRRNRTRATSQVAINQGVTTANAAVRGADWSAAEWRGDPARTATESETAQAHVAPVERSYRLVAQPRSPRSWTGRARVDRGTTRAGARHHAGGEHAGAADHGHGHEPLQPGAAVRD